MGHYLIAFNQQWVPDRPEAWFQARGDLARAVVNDMQAAGVLVFAGGLDEDLAAAFSADPSDGSVSFGAGPFMPREQVLGGLTIIDAPDDETARVWAGRVAEACGWPQEVRPFKEGLQPPS